MRYLTGAACGLLVLALAAPAAVAAPLPRATAPAAGHIVRVADGTVVWVQRYLLQHGYYNGAVDGVTGPRTAAGVRAFEAAQGWPVTGDPYVLAGRLGYAAPAPVPAPVVAPPPVVPPPVFLPGPGRPVFRPR